VKSNVVIYWILFVFFALAAALYVWWGLVDTHQNGVEWVGAVALSLSAVLFAFIAFYLGKSHKSQGGELFSDRLDANIDDEDPEVGHFSPWSWWPIILAGAASLILLGLAVGFWISLFAIPFLIIALVGWVYEYYRGNFGH